MDHSNVTKILDLAALTGRVSFENSFDSKQPKLEPKLVSALSETKLLFRLFRFYTEQRVSVFQLNRNKQKINRNKPKQTEMR